MPKALTPLSSYFSTLKGEATGFEFIGSTSIKVCHNLRIPQHKTFDGIAQRGKGTMGWFYGFMDLSYTSLPMLEEKSQKQNLSPVMSMTPSQYTELAKGVSGKLYADKGYISNKLKAALLDDGVYLVTNVRKK